MLDYFDFTLDNRVRTADHHKNVRDFIGFTGFFNVDFNRRP